MKYKDYCEIKSKVSNDICLRQFRLETGNGIIVDTNLLLLLLIGDIDENYITKFNRTDKFTKIDYYFLKEFINYYFDKIITTPTILTEFSHFIKKLDRNRKNLIFTYFSELLSKGTIEERHMDSEKVLKEDCLSYLGFVDASIVKISKNSERLGIISKDEHLCNELNKDRFTAIDFNLYKI